MSVPWIPCTSLCGTYVQLFGAVLPRRADTTAVIGTALWATARGIGYRRISAAVRRSASVRRWIRAIRDDYQP